MHHIIEAKSAIQARERAFATKHDLNIYKGCAHGCRYCFARYSHRYIGGDLFEDINVKENIASVLDKELSRPSWRGWPITLSGISDPYQPAEEEFQLMRKVLPVLIRHRNPVVITTKSVLILRDLDLIAELAQVAEVTVGVSLSTLDTNLAAELEPLASPPLDRLKALRRISELGIETTALVMPVIPYLTDDPDILRQIFRLVRAYRIDNINLWPLYLFDKNKKVMFEFISENRPELIKPFAELYRHGSVSDNYLNDLLKTVTDLRQEYGMFRTFKPRTLKNRIPALFNPQEGDEE